MSVIKTYQDFLQAGQAEKDRIEFILSAISEHKGTFEYKTAEKAELYYKHQNPTIMSYQKFVYNRLGRAVPFTWGANNKIASNWYNYFVTQAVQYLLGNGVTFTDKNTKNKLGLDFDKKIQTLATRAKNGGVSFGFWNYDRLETFDLTTFVPLWDEENSSLKAGIRFWQIDDNKPLRATLYELDGYTEYIKRHDKDMVVLKEKQAYKTSVKGDKKDEIDGTLEYIGKNYKSFPIVPFWNVNKQSELIGNQATIDAYDLMISGLVNNVSNGEFIYWILKNCGGMDDVDDAKFIEQLMITHVAHADGEDGASVDAHKVDVPFDASEAALNKLEMQLYKDFMALKVEDVSAGNVTATQIEAAYEMINQKTDQFEYEVTSFIKGILEIAEIDDTPTYTRSRAVNATETIDNVLKATDYLDSEYITKKLLTVLGDIDEVEKVLQRKAGEEIGRYESEG